MMHFYPFFSSTVHGKDSRLRRVCGARQRRNRLPSSKQKRLAFEALEDRRLLAVGVFERTGGGTLAKAEGWVSVPTSTYNIFSGSGEGDVAAEAGVAAEAFDDFGFAFIHNVHQAFAPPPFGAVTPAPHVHTSSIFKLLAEDEAEAKTEPLASDFATATAYYIYQPDPNFAEELEFHGHLFIAAYGGDVTVGNGEAYTGLSVRAEIGDYYLQASTGFFSNEWTLNWNLPGFGEGQAAWGDEGVNLHYVFTLSSIPSSFGASSSGMAEVQANNTGDSASLIWNLAAGSWGYVSGVGDGYDGVPGDFNVDGSVDSIDYDIWLQDDPRADADEDGDIDIDDFDVWAANATDTIIVSNASDVVDGNYSYGSLTLREALLLAADDVSYPGRDTIVFAPFVNDVLLTEGQLKIDSDVDILGPGADQVTIDGQGNDRVFFVDNGIDAHIRGITITGGDTIGGGNGGGIFSSAAELVLDGVIVEGNFASGGGGIYATGNLELRDSEIRNNVANFMAAGLYVDSAESVVIESSTIADNLSEGQFGGVLVVDADAEVRDSTVSTNSSIGGDYGAIAIYSGAANTSEFINTTITANHTEGSYGGITVLGDAQVTLHNSIVAGNTAVAQEPSDVAGAFESSSSHNIIGAIDGSTGLTGTGAIYGTKSDRVDPSLGPLAENGGPTRTHALLGTSVAIDKGSDEAASGLLFDQRGLYYERIAHGGTSLRVDIGAYEYKADMSGGSNGDEGGSASFAVGHEEPMADVRLVGNTFPATARDEAFAHLDAQSSELIASDNTRTGTNLGINEVLLLVLQSAEKFRSAATSSFEPIEAVQATPDYPANNYFFGELSLAFAELSLVRT